MGQFDKIIQRTTEKLYEDERLRTNLKDDEAKVVLGWAAQWINTQVTAAKDETQATQIAQNEFGRVRQSVNAMNALAAKSGTLSLADAVAAIQPPIQPQSVMPREKIFRLLTQLITAVWRTP